VRGRRPVDLLRLMPVVAYRSARLRPGVPAGGRPVDLLRLMPVVAYRESGGSVEADGR
jgi:hypothetical protein